ncbi:MAG: UDP-N-acetylmuramoyl-L-alanyl-D-glutamate--2,6-diaminopimelate ligase [Deltaproteobacteria bacterium]|nr:UDP-N-acetylmuramoyl-L-alanyl-D-glutamate--2,6-diaminopimelate ligase [Deltaproteobacteria bacterium]MBI3295507.1 UDP-N-acetylmuramoyl-L-alanyl-D-glutamate--2,6-diaminopimelate ligase [Deltaproteobacteria bacterium]
MKTLGQILSAPQRSKIDLTTPISGLANDSREAQAHHAFFVVSGKHTDGAQFIEAALARGVAALIVDSQALFDRFPKTVLIPSTRSALALAACEWHEHPASTMSVVGVTGTNGKTTSTFLLESIFQKAGFASGLIGTVEYRLGSQTRESDLTTPGPLQLQSLLAEMRDQNVTHASMEVSSIALDQCRSDGTEFASILFTNLTQDHLDYHGSFEEYYKTKRRLFTDYKARTAVINTDDPWGRRLLAEMSLSLKPITYGLLPTAQITPVSVRYDLQGLRAMVNVLGKEVELTSPLIGQHNLMNCLGVIGVAVALDISLTTVLEALRSATGAPGRLERVFSGPKGPSIFVDYAHTPDALENVLHSLKELRSRAHSNGRIITVFGCGGDRDRLKRPLMGQAAAQLSDITVATSDNPRTENPESIIDEIEKGMKHLPGRYFRNSKRAEAIALALSLASTDDIVLIAGKGHEAYQIIGREKLPFDDRKVIRDYYQAPSITHAEPGHIS